MKKVIILSVFEPKTLKSYRKITSCLEMLAVFMPEIDADKKKELCLYVETWPEMENSEIIRNFLTHFGFNIGNFVEKPEENPIEKDEKPENDEKERAKWPEKQSENLKQHSKPPFPGKTTTKTAVPFLNYVSEEPKPIDLPAIYDEFLAYLKTPEGNCEAPEMIADDVFRTFSDKITCLADCIELRSHV